MGDEPVNWKSGSISLVLVGAAALYMAHHGDVHRDRYGSLQDCMRDWQQHAGDCERQTAANGTHVFYGPRYEQGHRPQTSWSQLSTGSTVVTRSGFGSSGARFGAGS
jgi:uncharacterized protein YgiB involved in biofilm formation